MHNKNGRSRLRRRVGALAMALALALTLLPTTALAYDDGLNHDVRERKIYALVSDATPGAGGGAASSASTSTARIFAVMKNSAGNNGFDAQLTTFQEIGYGDRSSGLTMPYNNQISIAVDSHTTFRDLGVGLIVVPREGYLIKSIQVTDENCQDQSKSDRGHNYEPLTADGTLRAGSSYSNFPEGLSQLGGVLSKYASAGWDSLISGDGYDGQIPAGVFGYSGASLYQSYTNSNGTIVGFQRDMVISVETVQAPQTPVIVSLPDGETSVHEGQTVNISVQAITVGSAADTVGLSVSNVTREALPTLTVGGQVVTAAPDTSSPAQSVDVDGTPRMFDSFTYAYTVTQADYEYAQAHDGKLPVQATIEYSYTSPLLHNTTAVLGSGSLDVPMNGHLVTLKVRVPDREDEYFETYQITVPHGDTLNSTRATVVGAPAAANPLAPVPYDYRTVGTESGIPFGIYTTETGATYRTDKDEQVKSWDYLGFYGWAQDGVAYDLNTPVLEDLTLVSYYRDPVNVTFHVVDPTKDRSDADYADLFTYSHVVTYGSTVSKLAGWDIDVNQGKTLQEYLDLWNTASGYGAILGYITAPSDADQYVLLQWQTDPDNPIEQPFDFDRTPVTKDMDLYTYWLSKEADTLNILFLLENATWDGSSPLPKVVAIEKDADADATDLDIGKLLQENYIPVPSENYAADGTVSYTVPAPKAADENGYAYSFHGAGITPDELKNTSIPSEFWTAYQAKAQDNGWVSLGTLSGLSQAALPSVPNYVNTVFVRYSALPQVVYQDAAVGDGPAAYLGSLPAAATGTPGSPVTVAAGLTATSHENAAGQNGTWTFAGWTDGTNTYKPGEELTMPATPVLLTAVWSFQPYQQYQVAYTVTSTDNPAGIAAPETKSYEENSVQQVEPTLTAPAWTTKDGTADGLRGTWTFSGWTVSADKEKGASFYNNGRFQMPSHDLEFTGYWTFSPEDSYPVTYRLTSANNPAAVSGWTDPTASAASYQAGVSVTVATAPTAAWTTSDGTASGQQGTWSFSGWTPVSGITAADVSNGTFTMPAGAVEFTGAWTFRAAQAPTPPWTPSDDPYEDNYSTLDDAPIPLASADVTGVADWLNTLEHVAFLIGYTDGSFRPEANMTRGEAAMMFYRLLLDKTVENPVDFPDVAEDAYYAEAVRTLAGLGIIEGYPDGTFGPEDSITRAQFTTIAMRFAFQPIGGESRFSDVGEQDWFYEYVVGATQYGWIHGYTDGTFRPDAVIPRAEVTAIMDRMLVRSADESFTDANGELLKQFNDLNSDYWAYDEIVEATNAHEYTQSEESIEIEYWTRVF
jgi:hypothetical protein